MNNTFHVSIIEQSEREVCDVIEIVSDLQVKKTAVDTAMKNSLKLSGPRNKPYDLYFFSNDDIFEFIAR